MLRIHISALSALLVAIAVSAFPSWSQAQNVKGVGTEESKDSATPPLIELSPFLLEPEVQIRGDQIKQETYRSQPAGQGQNWNLDIGRFQSPINEDPNDLAQDLEQPYSGMRLRLPFRDRVPR